MATASDLPPIYLDHNATTPLAPEVATAMLEVYRSPCANPASQHQPGRLARRQLESARQRIVELLGARTTGRRPDRLIFTSGGTEANHLALRGLAAAAAEGASPPHQILLSAIEHPSIAMLGQLMAAEGWQVDVVPVHSGGVLDLGKIEQLLSPQTRLVSVMLGNNETGVLQPIAEIATLCHPRGVLLHTDAVQAVGKIDVQFADLGVDALSFTPHKFHGPVGIGGLLVGGETRLYPQMWGGFQQEGLRPGTEPVALAVGTQQALELAAAELPARTARLQDLRNHLEQKILAGYPSAQIVGAAAERLPHTSNIAFVGLDRQALVMALDLAGIACSTGSACASGSSEPSPTLLAMGCSEEVVRGSIRLSLGAYTTRPEIDQAAARILAICKQLDQQKGC